MSAKEADVLIWVDVVRLGFHAARQFKLPGIQRLKFEQKPIGSSEFGDYSSRTKTLRIRLHRLGRVTRLLTRSTIMATLAHELAHMKGLEHNAAHGELTRQIADWLRTQGQPVGHQLHSGRLIGYRESWKDPRPR